MALVVIIGGARSGKSRAAEALAARRHADGHPVVIAVFASESDLEMTERIAKHRAARPDGFTTVEAMGSPDWLGTVPDETLLVVDCLGTCLGGAMLDAWDATSAPGADMSDAEELSDAFVTEFMTRSDALVAALVNRGGDTIVVSNEVGLGVVPPFATGRMFRDALGRANATLVRTADSSWLAVAGRLLDLSTLSSDITWPTE